MTASERTSINAAGVDGGALVRQPHEHSRDGICAPLRSCIGRNAHWMLPAFIVFYSFIKEIKVGEPFLYAYQYEYLNLTRYQIKSEIYVFWPYTYAAALVPVFLLTDLLLYKPIMLLEMIGQIGFRSALVFGRSVNSQIAGEVSYGIASASEVAFFSYTYARLDKSQYQRITSWTRAGTMGGRTAGYAASQIIILAQLGDFRMLTIIALIVPCCCVLVCYTILPSVSWKRVMERVAAAEISPTEAKVVAHKEPRSYAAFGVQRARTLYCDFCTIYGSAFICKWSIWWALTSKHNMAGGSEQKAPLLAACMVLQFTLFSQALWSTVQTADSSRTPLNGFCEAGYTLVSALAILAMNEINVDWEKYGELTLVLISSFDAAIIFIYSQTECIYVMYACYITFRSLYQVIITIAQWNIAKRMKCESYGLLIGFNMFVGLTIQSVLTAIVTDSRGLAMGIREQYVVYASCHVVIALVFLCSIVYTRIVNCVRWRPNSGAAACNGHLDIMSATPLAADVDVAAKKEALREGVDRVDGHL